jgi:hypothetical protein
MNINKGIKKKEAVFRMKKWGLFKPIREAFEEDSLIAESAPPYGACYWLDKDQVKRIREFEKENNALVYHVIHSFTSFGEMESYLYVCDDQDEWELDHEDMEAGQQIAYVFNKTAPDCSEFGAIGVELTPAAGLRRTW